MAFVFILFFFFCFGCYTNKLGGFCGLVAFFSVAKMFCTIATFSHNNRIGWIFTKLNFLCRRQTASLQWLVHSVTGKFSKIAFSTRRRPWSSASSEEPNWHFFAFRFYTLYIVAMLLAPMRMSIAIPGKKVTLIQMQRGSFAHTYISFHA